MTVATIQADMRSAVRARLLSIALPLKAFTTAVTLSGLTLSAPTQPGLDFVALGFRVGDAVTLSGFSGANNGLHFLANVATTTLTFDAPLATTETVTGGQAAILLPAPAWENENYQPVKGQPFIAEQLRNAGSQVAALGRGGTIRHNLLATLTLFWPSGKGTLGLESMVGRLQELFRPGTAMVYGPNAGTVTNATQRPNLQEPEWISCPVIASITAWTAN